MGGANRALGAHGEELVARWYVAHGYTVLDRNWRNGRMGELDLVCALPAVATAADRLRGRLEMIVFCEVKTRTSTAFGHPWEAVSEQKLVRVRRLGNAWLAQHAVGSVRVRVDLAAVLAGRIEVMQGL